MLRLRDVILLAAVTAASLVGFFRPEETAVFIPAVRWSIMLILFLSFLNISPADVVTQVRRYPGRVSLLVVLKLIVLPVLVYPLALLIAPQYALGMLLLAGVATGVTAPFFTGQVGGSAPLALIMAALTSVLLPFTLPVITELLAGRTFEFDLIGMTIYLMVMIFGPLFAAGLIRRFLPRAKAWLAAKSFFFTVPLFVIIHLGVFSASAPHLSANPSQLLLAGALVLGLCAVVSALGAAVLWSSPWPVKVAGAGSMAWINSMIIVLIGAELGNPLTSVLAAIYSAPIYALYAGLGAWAKKFPPVEDVAAGQDQGRSLA